MRTRDLIIIALPLVALSAIGWTVYAHKSRPAADPPPIFLASSPTPIPTPDSPAVNPQPSTTPSPAPIASPTAKPLAQTVSIPVPYAVQAPMGIWDALHEDACEETSLIMIRHYLDKTEIGSPAQVDQEISDLVHWEEEHGYGPSITLEQLNQVAKDYFGLKNGTVTTIKSVNEIKTELAKKTPLILGMAGKELANPYFSNGGPNYHMLVATGYDTTGIITNDPGTKRGKDFHYTYQNFYASIHDWDAQDISNGQKAYLAFE